MDKRIASASISVDDEFSPVNLQLSPGINILWGEKAEEVMWTLVGIFSATPRQISAPLKAEVRWQDDISFWISGEINAGKSAIFVEDITLPLINHRTKYSAVTGLTYLDANDANAWPNTSLAEYYEVKSIIGKRW